MLNVQWKFLIRKRECCGKSTMVLKKEKTDGLLSLANVFKIQMACYSNCSIHRPLPKWSGSIYQLSQRHTCWIDGI